MFETSASKGLSLVLAHGKSNLSEAFRTIVNSTDMANDSEDETTSAFCTQWIADNRKKAFYADVGAGTIDQAFLAVLPKKHLTLRQYGLAGRILIVDEAHCFDAYMGEELSALLKLHAQNGGSAIVLSATLSLEQRRNMTEAFAKGLGLRDPEERKGVLFLCAPTTIPTGLGLCPKSGCGKNFSLELCRRPRIRPCTSRLNATGRSGSAARYLLP